MKTISELNEKWWYRLLKVVYVLIALAVIIFGIVLIYDESGPSFNSKKSFVTCLDGRVFTLEKYPTFYNAYAYTSDRANFQTWCTTEQTTDENDKVVMKKLENYNSINEQYRFTPVYDPTDWASIIQYSFYLIAITLTFAETIRRIFYYVVLGSVRPKKKHESDTILP